MEEKEGSKKGVLYVLLSGVLWGLISLFVRRLNALGLEAMQAVFVRVLLFYTCYFYTIAHASAAAAAVLLYTSPIFVTLLSRLLFREKLTGRKLIACALAVLGCALVSGILEGGAHGLTLMTLGTGLGGGIVMNGKIWAGAHGAGSELGHLVIEVDGVPCTCGKRGCAERYCSATAIIRMAKEACADAPNCAIMRAVDGDMDKINAKIVLDAAKEGDSVAT